MSVNQAVGQIRIHQIHKLPTPYTDFFFQALHENNNIDMQVYHLWRGSWRRPWKSQLATGYHNTYMRPILGIDWSLLKTAWFDVDSLFIVGDWAHMPSVAVILARWLCGAPVAIWTDTPQEDIKRPALKKWARSHFLRWLLPKMDVISGMGIKALRVLQEMGARAEQIVNLPVFVNLESPLQASQSPEVRAEAEGFRNLVGCGSGGIVFSMLGTLYEIKGIDIGLRAFAQCRQRVNRPMGLLIAGEGPQRQTLQSLANQLSLGDSVAFLGWQEPKGVDAVYLSSDIILHPSRRDAFPVVILEAMSWSKVVIGSDVCGNVEERIIHGVNGFSFPSEDVDELTRIMLDLVNHPEKLPEIGAQARKTAEEWPVERGVEIVLESARKVLATKSKAS